MLSTRNTRPFVVLIVATAFATQASAQSHEHPAAPEPPSAEAQKAFAALKSIAGGYQGYVTEPTNKINVLTDVALRVTSMGNVLVHELKASEDTDNPLKGQHPVTVMYMDGRNLLLTHYCDSGNRPRMTGRVSADGKVVDFDFLDVVGPVKYGHMQRARFTIIDPAHHIEDWTWEDPSGKTVTAHFDLKKVADYAIISGK
jgi:hypothetical protein